MNVHLYGAGRGGGKTTWLMQQVDDAVRRGDRVAVVVHARPYTIDVTAEADVYSEKTFDRARGRLYDCIFIDNADLFENDPAELCAQVAPGVPVTMTYTPSDRSTLRILAAPPPSQDSEPTLSDRDRQLLALVLAVRTGLPLKHTMDALEGTSAGVVGLLWRTTGLDSGGLHL